MRDGRVTTFNPFVASGFQPLENNFSAALAELFDPCKGHGFGTDLLKALLEAAREKAKGAGLDTNVDSIIRALNTTAPQHIRVERNYYHRDGRPDITIFGNDATKFIVIVENKAPGGLETNTSKGTQTSRYNRILEQLREVRGVDKRCALAIFLTPEGKKASDRSLVPLSSHELAVSMLRAIDTTQTSSLEIQYLARAFLITFDWLNGGT